MTKAHPYLRQWYGSDLPKMPFFGFFADYIPAQLCLPQAAWPGEQLHSHGCCKPKDECGLKSQHSSAYPDPVYLPTQVKGVPPLMEIACIYLFGAECGVFLYHFS